ncbi:MAG TPA: sigma-E factor regulatory protein RseB domain-containing protein [Armatimonadota bacterium]|nr:sigma-E factor regulatory protein RseB domain-containing protein [Armatimonadota bacterium]
MKRLVLPVLIVVAGLLTWGLLSRADQKMLSPQEVRRIVDAPDSSSYSAVGTTTFLYKGKPLSVRIKVFHDAPDKHRIEYLSSPLKGVTVVENGEQAWRCDPQCQAVVSMDCSGSGRLGLFLDNYVVERVGSDKAAGRSASVLLVKSKSGQAKKRLWVDAKTYIILRSEDYDATGKVQSSTRLDSIRYTPVPDSMFARPSSCPAGPGKVMSRAELSKAVGFQVKSPGYVPKGYRIDGYRLYECPCGCGHKSAYVRYTNGLEGISVFETRANSGCMKEGKCDVGMASCPLRDQLAFTSKDGISFVVLGDLKLDELRKITISIK